MNTQDSLIWELMLYKFEWGHNIIEAAKNTCCMKSEGTIYQPLRSGRIWHKVNF